MRITKIGKLTALAGLALLGSFNIAIGRDRHMSGHLTVPQAHDPPDRGHRRAGRRSMRVLTGRQLHAATISPPTWPNDTV